ncbi:MAG: DUF2059 domain-containing protein [Sphingomonas sp.]|nr:DUF2059 domain-containing protein [Sphingomonas sp.]
MRSLVLAAVAYLAMPQAASADEAPQQEPAPAAASKPASEAPSPERVAAAEQLIRALHIEAQYDRIFLQLIPVMTSQVFDSLKDNVKAPTALRKKLADPDALASAKRFFASEALAAFKRRYPSLITATAKEYAAAFSLDELHGLAAFYAAPLGQKALNVLPGIQQKLYPIGAEAGRDVGVEAMRKTLDHIDGAVGEVSS